MRKLIFKEYRGLFVDETGTEDDGPKRPGAPARITSARSWWRILNTIAGKDPLRFHEASRLKIREAFNWLAWKKDEAIKANLERQKSKHYSIR